MGAERAQNVLKLPPQTVPLAVLAQVHKPILLALLQDPEVRAALQALAGSQGAPRLTRMQLRLKKGWTTERLSQETGRLISASTIGHYENGTVGGLGVRNMKGFTALCQALGVTREMYLGAGTN